MRIYSINYDSEYSIFAHSRPDIRRGSEAFASLSLLDRLPILNQVQDRQKKPLKYYIPPVLDLFSGKETGWFATIMLRGCGIIKRAPIAQMDRASDYESAGRGFKSSWARQLFLSNKIQELPYPLFKSYLYSLKNSSTVSPAFFI